MKARLFVAFVPAVAAAFLLNCGDADICEGPQCAPSADGGVDGSRDAAGDVTVNDGAPGDGGGDGASSDAKGNTDSAPPGCNPSTDVSSQAACATDAFALFVDGNSGSDSGAGTKESPFKSITKAVAVGGRSSIFICAATYGETVTITSPVSLYGGFGCGSGVWTYTGAKTTVGMTGTAGATALTIKGTATPITIEDLDFEAADQSAVAGGTSIGALVANATGLVTFNRVTLHAGAGGTGASGVLTAVTFPDATTLQGQTGTANDGGAQVKVTCPAGGTTIGGAGGPNGNPGSPGQPDGGAGGVAGACNGPGAGSDGTTGTLGNMGAGATAAGQIGASGWLASAGADGGAGVPGSGGGGGFGQGNGGGGSGGAGGCGGQGGGGGSSGGSSIALLCSTSSVSVLASILTASDAGAGGAGAGGQSGQSPGGFRGLGYAESTACNGGNGGAGGPGGSGGGGAGGDSLAVAYSGAMPSLDSTSSTNAKVGSPGNAGTGGSVHVNDGTAGVATTAPTKF